MRTNFFGDKGDKQNNNKSVRKILYNVPPYHRVWVVWCQLNFFSIIFVVAVVVVVVVVVVVDKVLLILLII